MSAYKQQCVIYNMLMFDKSLWPLSLCQTSRFKIYTTRTYLSVQFVSCQSSGNFKVIHENMMPLYNPFAIRNNSKYLFEEFYCLLMKTSNLQTANGLSIKDGVYLFSTAVQSTFHTRQRHRTCSITDITINKL